MAPLAARALEVVWTDRAVSDLDAIGDFIARDDEAAAQRWLMKLIVLAEKVAAAPSIGRRVPELGRDDTRETFLGRYRLVYRIGARHLEVLTVFEGHRQLTADVVTDSDE